MTAQWIVVALVVEFFRLSDYFDFLRVFFGGAFFVFAHGVLLSKIGAVSGYISSRMI